MLTAVSFDFINGFHDTANAMATSIATKIHHRGNATIVVDPKLHWQASAASGAEWPADPYS